MSATRFRRVPVRWLSMLCVSLLVFSLMPPAAQAIDPIELADPALQQRYRDLSHELRCMQCQNQSIADSPVGLAGDLRREVRELLEAGKSDAEIREHMRERYGDFILFRPQWSARNAWLWVTPLLLLLLGVVVAWRVIRQRVALEGSDQFVAEESRERRADQ